MISIHEGFFLQFLGAISVQINQILDPTKSDSGGYEWSKLQLTLKVWKFAQKTMWSAIKGTWFVNQNIL